MAQTVVPSPTESFLPQKVLDDLLPIFAAAAVGDFSQDINLPEHEDLYTPLYAGVQVMVDVIREKIAALQQSNIQMHTQLNKTISQLSSIGEGIVTLDNTGKILFINPAGKSLLKIENETYLGKPWVDVVPLETETGEVIDSRLRPFEDSAAFVGGGPEVNHLYYRRFDKVRFPIAVTISPIFFEGKMNGHVIVFRDITKQRQSEQLKDDFLSVAAHELRTPLSTMRWTMESLIKLHSQEMSEETRKQLEILYENNLTMVSLVNDILSVTRLSQGKIDEKKVRLDSKKVIEEIVEEFVLQMKQLDLQANLTVAQDTNTEMEVDQTHLEQIFRNVISNAIKYSDKKSSIEIVIRADEKNRLCFDITNQGIGIPEGDKKRIFERFFRAGNVSGSSIIGTGLGLFVVKSYLDYWHGTISFSSEENKSTTFSLCFLHSQS